jgi:hypothetical protein
MGLGRKHVLLNLLSSIAVAGTVAALGIGLPEINDHVPSTRPIASGRPYAVGGGVSVTPPPGAGIDATKTRPGPINGAVLFLVGSVRYVVVVTPFDGSLAEAARRTQTKIEANQGYQVVGAQRPIRTAAGVAGLQGTYASPGRDGRFAVFLHDGVDAEVTVAGNGVDLRHVMPQVQASIQTLTFGNDS